MVTINKRETSF